MLPFQPPFQLITYNPLHISSPSKFTPVFDHNPLMMKHVAVHAGFVVHMYALLSFMWIWSKALPVLQHLSAAPTSSDVPSALNASEKNTTSTERAPPPRFFIGVSLTFGFTLMFVVDQIASYFSMRGKLAKLSHSLHFAECQRYIFLFTKCNVSFQTKGLACLTVSASQPRWGWLFILQVHRLTFTVHFWWLVFAQGTQGVSWNTRLPAWKVPDKALQLHMSTCDSACDFFTVWGF